MSSERPNTLLALKFAEDYVKYVVEYYNFSWETIAPSFPKRNLGRVPSGFTEYIGIVTISGPVLRHMYKQTENQKPIFPAVYETSPFEALLLIKQRAQSLLSSNKFSFFIMCSMLAKYCHAFIRNNRSEMIYIPLIALADIIVEEEIATTLVEWNRYAELALGLLAQKITPNTSEQRLVSKGITTPRGVTTDSTFWS